MLELSNERVSVYWTRKSVHAVRWRNNVCDSMRGTQCVVWLFLSAHLVLFLARERARASISLVSVAQSQLFCFVVYSGFAIFKCSVNHRKRMDTRYSIHTHHTYLLVVCDRRVCVRPYVCVCVRLWIRCCPCYCCGTIACCVSHHGQTVVLNCGSVVDRTPAASNNRQSTAHTGTCAPNGNRSHCVPYVLLQIFEFFTAVVSVRANSEYPAYVFHRSVTFWLDSFLRSKCFDLVGPRRDFEMCAGYLCS